MAAGTLAPCALTCAIFPAVQKEERCKRNAEGNDNDRLTLRVARINADSESSNGHDESPK